MHITPDQFVLWRWGWLHIDETMVCTWIADAAAHPRFLARSREDSREPHLPRTRWQTALEVVVQAIRGQIHDICPQASDPICLLWELCSSSLRFPVCWKSCPAGTHPPDRFPLLRHSPSASVSLSRSSAFSARGSRVFQALPESDSLMLPFHLLSETSRNLALAVRLFGNMMSGAMLVGVLLAIAPLFFLS